MPKEIYLDYNATTPVIPEVVNAIKVAMEKAWGNPSSGHSLGSRAKNALENAREQVAQIISASSQEIIFTSGGTESNNLAIIGAVRKHSYKGRHVITTKIEHPSVINPFIYLMEQGFDVDFISPEPNGIVTVDNIKKALRKDTIFCSVMFANNETGALQPIEEIGNICKQKGIIFHTDAAQAVGKIEIDVKKINVDLLTIAGHKLYAPKGIGALFIKNGVEIEKILFGAGQEKGIRPGTEPVPLAVGLGAACEFLKPKILELSDRLKELKKLLLELLLLENRDLVSFVPEDFCLPNTLFVAFKGLEGAKILEMAKNVFASTGAACHDRSIKISHVLSAMGVSEEIAKGVIRFSLGLHTTKEDISEAAKSINRAIERLRDG